MEKVKFAVQEWYERQVPALIPRDVESGKYLKNDFIIDILGVRRSGKTYLMYQFINNLKRDKNIIFLNFENRKLWPLTADILDKLLDFIYASELLVKYEKVYLFLDEIQNVPNWERFMRNIYDDFKGKIKVIISGSSSRFGEKETASLITGRHLSIRLFPLSFREFLRFKKYNIEDIEYSQRKKAGLLNLLEEYLEFGGFPEVVLSEEKSEILNQYYIDIISRDVIERYRVRETNIMENLGKYVIANSGALFSYGKTAKFFHNSLKLKVSTASIQSYTRYLESVFLIFLVPIFSYKIKEQMQYPRKVYCIDTGLRNAVSFRFRENFGKLMENAVFIELKRRGKDVYYWKDYQQREVDFVIKEGLKVKQLIQVCYSIDDMDTKKREISGLLEAMEEFKLKKGLIITRDFEGSEEIKGRKIKYVPLWKWLLYEGP